MKPMHEMTLSELRAEYIRLKATDSEHGRTKRANQIKALDAWIAKRVKEES
jgi:hypothetical protein